MMIDVRDLRVHLGGRTVVESVSFRAQAGECIFVLGANGAGKSTLLRALAGLLPASGDVRINGSALATFSPGARARQLAYLPQGHSVHWPLPARDVVAIGRLPHGSSLVHLRLDDAAAIDRALAAVDATHLADRPVTELSGGERARVLLARALAVEAPVLLADEPIAALDPDHQLAVMELLRQIVGGGRLVIAAMHDLLLASRFATRILLLDQGRLIGDGAPASVLTDAALAQAFAIRSTRLVHEGQSLVVPWTREHSHR
jgi:iron complex transport system ATP-binding protein